MSLQAYRLFFEKFPMPSLSLLSNIQQGGAEVLKVLKTLYEKGSISRYCISIIDEMYLQKSVQYQLGEYVGVDEERNLYKGIFAFVVVGLKQSIPFVVQAIVHVTFNGQWLAEKFSDNIDILIEIVLCVRGMVTENHSINTLSALIKITF